MNKRIIKKELTKYVSEVTLGRDDSITYAVNTKDKVAVDTAKAESKIDGVDSTIELTSEDDRDKDELNGLDFDDKDERAIEYGIQNEKFDKLMAELTKSGSPTIKLAESVNPRIKVKDLVNHLKNKK